MTKHYAAGALRSLPSTDGGVAPSSRVFYYPGRTHGPAPPALQAPAATSAWKPFSAMISITFHSPRPWRLPPWGHFAAARRLSVWLAWASLATSGCASSWNSNFVAGSRQIDEGSSRSTATAPVTSRGETTAPSQTPPASVAEEEPLHPGLALASATTPSTDSEAALADVLDELLEIGAISPDAQNQVMEALKDAKPEHYPLVVRQFRAALAYRQQLAERDADANEALVEATDSHAETHALEDDEQRGPLPAEYLAPTELPPPPVEVATLRHPTPSRSGAEVVDRRPADEDSPRGWRETMDDAIGALSDEVRPMPRSTDELHDHMRLRALNMLAGRGEEAYRPIPGAAAGPQEFWSKQLFAMATYLDDSNDIDDKQRAAAALVHLDEARDKLAELATLQLRNSAFVKNVEGFGAYEPLVEARFRPAERVTIYAEVENFRSESTADGYRTRLATSYQVLDESERRVDGGQFREVVDVCHNRRRDFHMQFAVPLPERIYPGKYQLELVITDQLSNKIGQQRIPFQIVE